MIIDPSTSCSFIEPIFLALHYPVSTYILIRNYDFDFYSNSKKKIVVFRNRPLLKKMKHMGYSQIVLDCSAEKTRLLLKQAQQLGMTGTYHSYLLTSLVRMYSLMH